jgi:hypothetical protein
MAPWSWFWLTWFLTGVAAELYVVAVGPRTARLSQNVWLLQDSLPDPFAWRLLTGGMLLILAIHLSVGPRH